jgi:predicted ATPase
MIKEIKIENFKSIPSLNLELGRLNVFIGANGSGKSNILEGIALGSAVSEDKGDNEFLSARGIRVVSKEQMESAFDKSEKNIFVEFVTDVHAQQILIEYSVKKWVQQKRKKYDVHEKIMIKEFAKILEEKVNSDIVETFNLVINHLEKDEDIVESNLSQKQMDNIKLLENVFKNITAYVRPTVEYLDFLIFAPENTFLRRFEEETQIQPLGIRGEGLFKEIVEISEQKPEQFAKINEHLQFLDWFEGFEIPNDLKFTEQRIKIKDKFLEDGLQFIDQRSANEGFLYLLFYLTLFISDDTPKFFAIDNIDNAMNPKLGSELIRILSKLAKEHDKQVILTTHNPSVLDGLDLSDDEQRLFVISRNKSGHTQAIRVPHRESEERLSTRFIRGSIGGLPKNF